MKLCKWLSIPLSFKVFNVNAPLPPRKEQEIKESTYSPGYNQSFTTASTQTPLQCQLPAIHVEQTVLSQETGKTLVYGIWRLRWQLIGKQLCSDTLAVLSRAVSIISLHVQCWQIFDAFSSVKFTILTFVKVEINWLRRIYKLIFLNLIVLIAIDNGSGR